MAEQPNNSAKSIPGGKKTLAGVIGTAVGAALLFAAVPREESGRVVSATVNSDQSVTVKNVSGKLYLKTYLDIVGVPTACDGITKGVKLGQTYTEGQCNALLEQELIAHAEPVIHCIPHLYGRPYQAAAAVSLSYNIGTAGVCKSSIAQLWNQGLWAAGCDRFLLFNKAGGRVISGLAARRGRERQICLTGIHPGYTPDNLATRVKGVRA